MKVECCICFEEFKLNNRDNRITSLKCGHLFHRNCIELWIKNSHSCPNCRDHASLRHFRDIFVTNAENRRASDIFNSTIVNNFREVQDDLLREQESLEQLNQVLQLENDRLNRMNEALKTENEQLRHITKIFKDGGVVNIVDICNMQNRK